MADADEDLTGGYERRVAEEDASWGALAERVYIEVDDVIDSLIQLADERPADRFAGTGRKARAWAITLTSLRDDLKRQAGSLRSKHEEAPDG